MISFRVYLLLLTTLCTVAKAGFVPPAEWCLPSAHLKELSGCIAMTDKEDECGGKSSDEEKLDCYCTQEMLSSFYDCEKDVRQCLETHMFDPQFDNKIRQWHSTCDQRISSSMTTPALPTITASYDFGACARLQKSCISGDYETNKCSLKYMPTSSLSYASCVCQPPVYSLFSECQYNGNISCKRTTAAESNIVGYAVCSYFWTGSETLSSIDLTSFLGITGQSNMQPLTRSPQKMINIPGVNDGSWTTMIKPAPPGTTMTAAKTARVHVDGGGLNNELR